MVEAAVPDRGASATGLSAVRPPTSSRPGPCSTRSERRCGGSPSRSATPAITPQPSRSGTALPNHSLGPDHARTLAAQTHLAYWTGLAGDPATARDLFTELLPDQERVFRQHSAFCPSVRTFSTSSRRPASGPLAGPDSARLAASLPARRPGRPSPTAAEDDESPGHRPQASTEASQPTDSTTRHGDRFAEGPGLCPVPRQDPTRALDPGRAHHYP